MIIRFAEPDDALAVGRVHVRSWQAGYKGLMPEEYLEGLRAEERAEHYTFDRRGPNGPETVVAVDPAGEICGFATTGSAASDGSLIVPAELYALYVDPDHWRHGVGRDLMANVIERLISYGYQRAVLWVLDGNTRAESFYRSTGWESDGTERVAEVWNIEVRENRYGRDL